MEDMNTKRRASYEERVNLLYQQGKGVDSASPNNNLLEDMRKMVNNPEYADTTFRCEDGVDVVACRVLLVARSPVFRKMLMNGMAESYQSVIVMPNVSSFVLLVVFEFLYVGEIRKEIFGEFLLQWNQVFAVISAARYFMLDDVEVIIIHLLWNELMEILDLPSTDHILQLFGFKLSAACDFIEMLNDDSVVGNLDIICMELVEFLHSADLTEAHLQTFSQNAVHYYLLNTKRRDYCEVGQISFHEYVKFRQLVMWCNCQLPDASQLQNIDTCLPAPKRVMSLLNDDHLLENAECVDYSVWWSTVLRYLTPSFVENLQSLINLSLLHPAILCKFIHPLGMFHDSDVIKALSVHAVINCRGRDWRPAVTPVYSWKFLDGSQYKRCGDASSLCTELGVGSLTGTALCEVALPPYGIFEWDITLSADTRDQLIVGFKGFYRRVSGMSDGLLSCLKKELGFLPDSWGLLLKGCTGVPCSTGMISSSPTSWVLPQGKVFGKKSKVMRVHLNRFDRTCSFYYDGENSGIMWTDLPNGIFYPAVTLRSTGRAVYVKLNLVSGLEYL